MEKKRVKKFRYKGLGFSIVLFDVPMVKVRDIWTPAIDYNELQKAVLWSYATCPFLFLVTKCISSEPILR